MNDQSYPDAPGHQNVDTSIEAAATVDANYLRGCVIQCLTNYGDLSPDQCAGLLKLSILSIRPRFTELHKKDRIERTGKKAKTASHRSAHVYRLKQAVEPAVAPSSISLTLKDGTVVSYSTPFDMKDDKYLVKFSLKRDGESEGPWIRLHPDDKADYDANVRDSKVRLAVMSNDCLAGIPWLALTPYVMTGDGRPACNMNELIDMTSAPQFIGVETGWPISSEEYKAFRTK